jgi:hypothetical protein
VEVVVAEVTEVWSHPLALGVRPTASSRFVTDLGGGRLSTTRVLLLDGEAAVADLPRDYDARPDVFCPFCGELGKYRHLEHREGTSHFAHATGDECVVAALETALHRRAKALLCEGLAWLRGQQRSVLVKTPCLRCDEPTAIPMLRPADWDMEAPEVELGALRLDVAALRGGVPSAVFEVRVSHAVEAEKASELRSSGLPSAEFLATALIDEATGVVSWRFEEPLPCPEKHWNLEREGYPFALCRECRELPEDAAALAQVVPLVADAATLKLLRAGLPEASEASLVGLDVSGLLGAWQRPEEVSWSVAKRLAKVKAGLLVSAEAAELAELLANPYGRALEIAKSEREVPRLELLAADDAWKALKAEARRAHRDRRRQTHVLHSVARQASKGSTAVSTASLVGVVRDVAPEDVDTFRSDIAKLTLASTPLAGGNGFVGFSSVIVAEKKVLDRVRARVRRKPLRPSMSAPTDDERERAVGLAFTRSFAIITGGPGTGKTTAVRRLLECVATERAMQVEGQRGARWLLCAPTHKALSRLKQGLSGFDFVEFRTVQAAVRLSFEVPPVGVLVDEASFLDSSLAAELFEKFAKTDQIVLVGDPDQLPSVAPGAVLRDLIANFPNSVQRMTTNHRTEGRALAEAATAMNTGRQPEPRPGEVDIVELVDSASVEEQALSWYRKLANGRAAGDVQVLAGLRKTVGALNAKLQLLQNPEGRSLTPWLRAGDRVVVTEILERELAPGLHRGLMGTIHAGDNEKLLLRTDDGSPVSVDLGAVSVEPSYAMTVHRSQGSEWPCVLMVLDDTSFLTRNLVYTAFTRARSRAVVLSPKGMLRKSLGRVPQRLTGLSTGLLRTLL